jgi:hypothetical protein
MIDVELFRDEGIVTVFPTGPLSQADFTELAGLVDPYLEAHGKLNGVMLTVAHLPGWDNLAALVNHLRFVRDHQARIRRVAVLTDSPVVELLPALARHFVQAEVRRFAFDQREPAFDWLKAAPHA